MDVILTGTVTSQTNSLALVNARVEAWDSAPGALRPIAMGPVKSGGAFAVVVPDRAATAIADRVIELRVVYQGALLRLTQPLTWRSGQKADGLQLIAAVDARGRDVAGARSVSGRVTQIASGRAVAGVLVRAFDRDLRAEPLLGEAHTGADGRYSLVYYGAALSRPGKAAANLFVRVFDSSGQTLLYDPPLEQMQISAAADAVVNISLAASPRRLRSNISRYNAILRPCWARWRSPTSSKTSSSAM
jgi:hypothetical protein